MTNMLMKMPAASGEATPYNALAGSAYNRNSPLQDMLYRPEVDPLAGRRSGYKDLLFRPGEDFTVVSQGRPRPSPIPTDTAQAATAPTDALAPTSFSIADIYAALGLPMDAADTSYWGNRQQQGVSQENVSSTLPALNSAFQQLLGRDMQAGVAQHLDPILQNQGMQAVRQNVAGTDEYLNRMLNNPGQTNVPAWQQAARQGTMHQAMMPGSFWDYSNPLLSNPAEAANIMGFKDGSISQMLMDAFTDPESDLLKQLLGTKDDKDKKAATGGGRPQGNRFAPNPEGETFFERVRGY